MTSPPRPHFSPPAGSNTGPSFSSEPVPPWTEHKTAPVPSSSPENHGIVVDQQMLHEQAPLLYTQAIPNYAAIDFKDEASRINSGVEHPLMKQGSFSHGSPFPHPDAPSLKIPSFLSQPPPVIFHRSHSSREYYPHDWWNSFDLVFLVFMILLLTALIAGTMVLHPHLITGATTTYRSFWLQQIFRFGIMMLAAEVGGALAIRYNLKINYTRKIQHFLAYLVPLLSGVSTHTAQQVHQQDVTATTVGLSIILSWWTYFFTLCSFLIMIYPARTRIRCLDIAFASLDRPEDRPNTLMWIVTQIVAGYIILTAFTTYFDVTHHTDLKSLSLIPVLIIGFGDGLAEPIGIRFGRHKYSSRALCSDQPFTRSYEGSACVLIASIIAILLFMSRFNAWIHVCVALLTIPICMTLAEAYSPHTWDTPLLMFTGLSLLWVISFIPPIW